MGTIYLVRHGEVDGNMGERRTYVGWNDKPLNAQGELQAAAVAQRLKREPVRAVYSSDLPRAQGTAERIAAEHGLNVQSRAGLREANYGVWEGLTEEEINAGWTEQWRQRQLDPITVAPPEGESYTDVLRRWQLEWQQIVEQHRDEAAVIVSHRGAMRVWFCHLLDMPLNAYRRIDVSNCGLSRIEVTLKDGATPSIVMGCINETCHLANC
jgi:broad specificity phosphatase PhoE